jgi:peptidoglycan/LPS O-acetylase OafA/YrhL
VTLTAGTRHKLFSAGLFLLLLDVVFYAAWQRHQFSNPCHQKPLGIYFGFLVGAVSLLLSLLGKGWKRITLATVTLITLYIWFSWLASMVQIEC